MDVSLCVRVRVCMRLSFHNEDEKSQKERSILAPTLSASTTSPLSTEISVTTIRDKDMKVFFAIFTVELVVLKLEYC